MIMWLLLAILAACVSQLVREVLAVVAAKRGPELIHRAVARVPEKRRDTRRDEWLAEFEWLAQRNAHFLSLKYAVGVWVGAARIHRESQSGAEAPGLKTAWRTFINRLEVATTPGTRYFLASGSYMALVYLAMGVGFLAIYNNGWTLSAGVVCLLVSAGYLIAVLSDLGRRLHLWRRSRRAR